MRHEAYKSVSDLVADRAWNPGNGIDSASNYLGEDFSQFVVGLSRSRDSDLVTESNFWSLLSTLGGESNSVRVVRFGHWGCGWFEQIHVSKRAPRKLETLRECLNALADYPLLDESDYSEREHEYRQQCLEDYRDDWAASVVAWVRGLDSDRGLEFDPEDYGTESEWTAALSALYSEECGYSGSEEAYIDVDDMPRLSKCWQIKQLAIDGNPVARIIRDRAAYLKGKGDSK